MRQLVSGSLGRRISWALVVALVLPLLVLALPPKQARAQLSRQPPVAVLDFGVMPASRTSGILSRNATDAVVVELAHTERFDVQTRSQLLQQIQDLGLTTPLNVNGIQKLGRAMNVDFVVSGDVTAIHFSDNPRRASVTLSVRMFDVVSGELANGAIATGFSAPAPSGIQADDETLISQAVSDAAYNAVKTINNYTLPEATVLTTRGTDEVTLNRGSRDGMVAGQDMIIIRGHDRVGRVRVTSVGPSDSLAAVTELGKGIRPEDRARAIFQIPGLTVDQNGDIRSDNPETINYTPHANHGKPILSTIFGVAAAVLLASLLFSNKSSNAGKAIGNVTAQAYAEGSDPLATPDTTAARVKLTWNPASDIAYPYILEYHIYRDDVIIGNVTNPAVTTFIDKPTADYTEVTYYTVSLTGNLSGNSPGNTNQTGTTSTGTTGTGTNTGTGSNSGTNNGLGSNSNGSSSNSNSTNTSTAPQTFLVSNTVPVSGMQVGVPHRYRVSMLYQQIQTSTTSSSSGTTGTGGTTASGGTTTSSGGTNSSNSSTVYKESNLNASSGTATPLARPSAGTTPLNASNKGLLSAIQIPFTPTSGADQYIIEFADNPGYTTKVVEPIFYRSATSTSTQKSDVYDISAKFAKLADNALIYYRVGARSTIDSPGPSGEGTPNGGNYIYSANSTSFQKPSTPPTSP